MRHGGERQQHGQARGGRRVDRHVHDVQPGRRAPGQGGVLGVADLPRASTSRTPTALINKPIGTGPYMLEAWERGSQIVLDANPDYWGDAGAVADRRVPVEPGGRPAPRRSCSRAPSTASTTSAPTTSSTVEGEPRPPARRARPAERVLPRLQRRHGAVRRRGGAPGDRLGHRQGSASSTTSTRRARSRPTSSSRRASPVRGGRDDVHVRRRGRPRR